METERGEGASALSGSFSPSYLPTYLYVPSVPFCPRNSLLASFSSTLASPTSALSLRDKTRTVTSVLLQLLSLVFVEACHTPLRRSA